MPESQRLAIGAARKGIRNTPEQRRKCSATTKGRKRGPRPPEVVERIAESMRAALWKRKITVSLRDKIRFWIG